MLKKGDYVTARLLDKEDCRQGVVTDIIGDTLQLEGELETYFCQKEGAVIVPDRNIIFTPEFVNILRGQNSLDWYGSLEYPKAGR